MYNTKKDFKILIPDQSRYYDESTETSFGFGMKLYYMDKMFVKSISLQSNTCFQVWTYGVSYSLFYHHLKSKREAPMTVWKMIQDLQDIPEVIVLWNGLGKKTGVKCKDEINLILQMHMMEHASP